MVFSRNTLMSLAFALLGSAGTVHGQTSSVDSAQAAATAVVEKFGRALTAGDSIGALNLLHDDVTIYEGGHAETKEQYRSGHVRSDIAFSSAVQRTTISSNVVVSGDIAVYTGTNKSSGRYRNRDVNSEGTETIVLVRTPAGWKIRHIHWS